MNRTSEVLGAGEIPRYPVRAVADRVGVPIATLRSWNQRYGIGPADHSPGRHRLYSEADIALVQQMRRLIGRGANPGSVARAALDSMVPAPADTDALLGAAFELDVFQAGGLLDRHLRRYGVIDTWDQLIRPAISAIAARQADGESCIDVEHALSWTVSRSLQQLPITAPDGSASTVLACSEGDEHTLALEALRAALGERGLAAVMLGADVPAAALTDAVARIAIPTTVVLWAQSGRTADVATVRAVLAARARLLLGGPGWKSVRLPSKATRVESLGAAVALLAADADNG
jgi:MerR family transcriptional regulator, light-induced transcriptional regulator